MDDNEYGQKSGRKRQKTDGAQDASGASVSRDRGRRRLAYGGLFVILFLTELLIAVFVHDAFIRPYVGDILVVPVVYAFLRILFPDGVHWLWLYVVLFAIGVEAAQYFQLTRLLGLEKYRIANIILGSVFDWRDILCYVAGGLLIKVSSLGWKHYYNRKPLPPQ